MNDTDEDGDDTYPVGFYLSGDGFNSVLSELIVPGWFAKVLALLLLLAAL
jgi:hypothetical protein